MDPTLFLFLSYLGACLSCFGAVMSWLISRRGGDAALKGDVNELAILVDRLAKAERRERMQRVRRGEKTGESGNGTFEVPPGAEDVPLVASSPHNPKDELRRRVLASRGIGR